MFENIVFKNFEKENDLSSLGKCGILKMTLLYLAHSIPSAFSLRIKIKHYLKGLKGSAFHPIFHFISSLIL